MRITYLLEGTDLWGGVKVVLEQADELHRRGVAVTVLGKGPKPDWYPLEAPFREVTEFSRETIPPSDFVIATFWKTVLPAVQSGRGTVVHLCQGYEGDLKHYESLVPEIERAYRMNTLKITVSPHLTDLIRHRFHQQAWCIGQTLDHRVFFPVSPAPPFPPVPRIILVGIYECESKGIDHGLRALQRLRQQGIPFELVRVSQLPPSPEERAFDLPGTYRTNVPPLEMAELYRSCHLSLALSTDAEGFGLPAIEALACGLPSVFTRASALWNLDPNRDYALFVPPASPDRTAEAILRLIRDARLREKLSKRGRAVALRYSTSRTVSRLLSVLQHHRD